MLVNRLDESQEQDGTSNTVASYLDSDSDSNDGGGGDDYLNFEENNRPYAQ